MLAQENDTLLTRILAMRNDTEKVNQLYKAGFSTETSAQAFTNNTPVRNPLLLISVLIFAILIPLIFIRYKR